VQEAGRIVTDNLVLRIRIEVLRRNLELVGETVKTLRERQRHLDSFLNFPSKVEAELTGALKIVKDAQMLIVDPSDEEADISQTSEDLLNNLWSSLSQMLADVRKVKKDATGERNRAEALTEVGQDLQDDLITKARDMVKLEENWDSYRRRAQESQGLFEEYVALLQGVALRDAGFDRDLFRIADRLPSLWRRPSGYSWHSMAIPSGSEIMGQSAARVLRIGFPEWTVFALPLLQHEFGHVFLKWTRYERTGAGPQEGTAGLGGLSALDRPLTPVAPAREDQTDTICMADAAAVCVTGPAYACAVLFMRLDPAEVKTADCLTARRAAVILGTLARIAGKIPQGSPLTLVHLRLKTEWENAVSQVGNIDAMHAAEQSDDVRKWATEAWRLVTTPDPKVEPALPQWAEHWAVVYQWSVQLREASQPGSQLAAINMTSIKSTDSTPFALTLALNAAWLVRAGAAQNLDDPTPPQPDVVAPEEVEKVGQDVVRCCLQLVDQLGTGLAGPARPPEYTVSRGTARKPVRSE
jgi:hypothetical protein